MYHFNLAASFFHRSLKIDRIEQTLRCCILLVFASGGIMSDILIRALSFVVVMGLGYGLRRIGFFRKKDAQLLSRIIVRITLPCTILVNTETFKITSTLFLIMAFIVCVSLALSFFGRFVFRKHTDAIQAMAMVNSSGYNIGNLTLPLVLSFYASADIAFLAMFDIGNALMGLGGIYALAASMYAPGVKRFDISSMFRTLMSSWPFMTYILILLLSVLNLTIPISVKQFLLPIGQANTFLSMLMIGIQLDFSLERSEYMMIFKLLMIRLSGASVFSLLFFTFMPVPLAAKQLVTLCLFSSCISISPIYSWQLGDRSSVSPILNSITIFIAITVTSVLLMLFHIG